MRPPTAFALLIVFVAALIGCKKRGEDGQGGEGPIVIGGGNSGGKGGGNGGDGPTIIGGRADEPPPPWPPLPEVPPRPKGYPNTHGGQIAWAMDAAADGLINRGTPEKETYDRWELYCFRKAFADAEKAIKGFPKVVLEKELFAPAGNAGKERDLLDKSFARLFAAWTRYWEMHRRWEVARAEELLHRLEPKHSPKKLREEAERSHPPGREVKVGNADLGQTRIGKHDWYTLTVSGVENTSYSVMGGGWATGRLDFRKSFTLSTGPMAAVLTGSVGEELILQGAPAVIDLNEFVAPFVRIDCGEDVVVRVGPGIGKLEINPRHGIVLARGNPKLQVRTFADRHPVAVVGY